MVIKEDPLPHQSSDANGSHCIKFCKIEKHPTKSQQLPGHSNLMCLSLTHFPSRVTNLQVWPEDLPADPQITEISFPDENSCFGGQAPWHPISAKVPPQPPGIPQLRRSLKSSLATHDHQPAPQHSPSLQGHTKTLRKGSVCRTNKHI